MSAIAVEGPARAPGKTLTKQRLKWLLYVGLAGFLALGAARYGYDWWTDGRFIETTDDAYVGGNVTPISPHVAASSPRSWSTDNQFVRAGQPLIRLDDRDYRAALDHATAVVAARAGDARQPPGAIARCSNRPSARRRPTSRRRRRRRPSPSRTTCAIGSLAQTAAGSRQDAQSALGAGRRRRSRASPRPPPGSTPPGSNSRCSTRTSPRPPPPSPRPRPTCRPPGSISATPKSARRSTAMSATAPPRSAPTSPPAPIWLSVIPAHGLWVDANFKEDQLARMTPGPAAHRRRRRAAGPRLSRPRRQPRPRHRRRVQRHPAGERDRQLHQDRAARAGPHPAGRRRPAAPMRCARACPPRSASTRARVRRGAPMTEAPIRRALAAQPRALRGDVRRHVHRAAGHPDRRVLLAGYRRRPVRGAGRDQLGADRLSDRRDHHDPAVRLADAGVLHPLAVHRFGRRLHR